MLTFCGVKKISARILFIFKQNFCGLKNYSDSFLNKILYLLNLLVKLNFYLTRNKNTNKCKMNNANDISNSSQQKCIEKASKAKNPLENFPEVMKYITKDYEINLYCKTKSDMDSKTLKWAFKLAERNVGPYYKTNSIGWQPKIKQADLNKNWARYYVALDKSKNPIAYAMFRFDYDYGNSVLYCYEMQIEKFMQRKGLGKFMMTALEKCGKYWGMEKIVLTVLKNNPDSMAFFIKLGYTADDTTPDTEDNVDYEILSKSFY